MVLSGNGSSNCLWSKGVQFYFVSFKQYIYSWLFLHINSCTSESSLLDGLTHFLKLETKPPITLPLIQPFSSTLSHPPPPPPPTPNTKAYISLLSRLKLTQAASYLLKWWFQLLLAPKRLQGCLKSFANVVNWQHKYCWMCKITWNSSSRIFISVSLFPPHITCVQYIKFSSKSMRAHKKCQESSKRNMLFCWWFKSDFSFSS